MPFSATVLKKLSISITYTKIRLLKPRTDYKRALKTENYKSDVENSIINNTHHIYLELYQGQYHQLVSDDREGEVLLRKLLERHHAKNPQHRPSPV